VEDREAYEKAKKRMEAKIGFYIHLAVYAGVNVLLIVINLTTSPQYLWFKWPLFGWGIGLFFQGMSIFVFSGRKAGRPPSRIFLDKKFCLLQSSHPFPPRLSSHDLLRKSSLVPGNRGPLAAQAGFQCCAARGKQNKKRPWQENPGSLFSF